MQKKAPSPFQLPTLLKAGLRKLHIRASRVGLDGGADWSHLPVHTCSFRTSTFRETQSHEQQAMAATVFAVKILERFRAGSQDLRVLSSCSMFNA